MKFLFYLFLFAIISAYEKILISSDNDSLMDVVRDDTLDTVTVKSETRITVNYKQSLDKHFIVPEGLQTFNFIITNPEYNKGRFARDVSIQGVTLTLTYDHQRKLTGLCSLFSQLLPSFNVKQCNTHKNITVYDIDLDDAIWRPVNLVPFSTLKPTNIVGKEWNRIASIFIPYDKLNYDNYYDGGGIASIYNTGNLFDIESKKWYPHTKDANLRFVELEVKIGRFHEFFIYDSYHIKAPLIIPDKSKIDSIHSDVDLIFHEQVKVDEFARFTANKKKILYPVHETPLWTGDIRMTIEGEQLHYEGYVTARDGSYNPYLPVYDSRVGTVLYLPKGVYVDLAEMKLMYDMGKIPAYFSYVSNIDTDASYEESKPQIIAFIEESSIYPLPPMMEINRTIPIHYRHSFTEKPINVSIPLPSFYVCTPVRDTIIPNYKNKWWEPVYPYPQTINVLLPIKDKQYEDMKEKIYLGLAATCAFMLCVEIIKKCFE